MQAESGEAKTQAQVSMGSLSGLTKYPWLPALIAGTVYLVGILVVHLAALHSVGTGFFIPLLRVRYVLTGVTGLLFLLQPMLLIPPRAPFLNVAGRMALVCLAVALLAYVLFAGQYSGGWLNLLCYYATLVVYWYVVYWVFYATMWLGFASDETRAWVSLVVPTGLVLMTFFMLFAYAILLYPNLAPSVGGGRPVPVRLLLSDQGRSSLAPLGARLEEDGWTSVIGLRDSTDKEHMLQQIKGSSSVLRIGKYRLRIPTRRPEVVSLDRGLVRGIYFVSSDEAVARP